MKSGQRESNSIDVAVVGGGLAGWMAAVRAQELGSDVVLLERSRRPAGWGNSMISGGAVHAILGPVDLPPEDLVTRARTVTDGAVEDAVVQSWARNAQRTVAWISEHGGSLVQDGTEPHRRAVFAPVRETVPGLKSEGYGTPIFLTSLSTRFVANGGRVLQPARARTLRRADGGAWELEAEGPEGPIVVRTRSVVLADGGFQANPEMLREYIGTDRVKLRGTEMSTGDALKMGMSVGAAITHMSGFYGHMLVREALTDQRLWPYPTLDTVASVGVVVDKFGHRFVDESDSGVGTTNAVVRSASPDECWLLFDDRAWSGAGTRGTTPPNPYLDECGATVLRAETMSEIARLASLPSGTLEATVDLVSRSPGQATPPRAKAPSLSVPPFYAIPIIAGVTFTFGGLLVDGEARVLTEARVPVAGLYAAGGAMGGLHGGPRDGYLGGLLEAAVFGLIAGERAHTADT